MTPKAIIVSNFRLVAVVARTIWRHSRISNESLLSLLLSFFFIPFLLLLFFFRYHIIVYTGFRVGEVLNKKYRVFAAHGKGVFSTVLRAKEITKDDKEGDEVAIKVIRNNDLMYVFSSFLLSFCPKNNSGITGIDRE